MGEKNKHPRFFEQRKAGQMNKKKFLKNFLKKFFVTCE